MFSDCGQLELEIGKWELIWNQRWLEWNSSVLQPRGQKKMSEDESRLEVRGTDNEHRKPGEWSQM